MAEKKSTQQMGLRLDALLLQEMREYANAHPFHPSLTSLLNAAMKEWLEKHRSEVEKKRR